jgi:hypothetical protein
MGRWGDALEAYMRTHDTADTADTSPPDASVTAQSVNSVSSVTLSTDQGEQTPDPWGPTCGNSVSSVTRNAGSARSPLGHSGSTVSHSSPQSADAPIPVKRPVSWADATDEPTPGNFCSCCRSRRWWRETHKPSGWCCWTCHPPDHLPPEGVTEVTT